MTSSARALELGKSLSLECTIRGYPIHRVVFMHNQNIIKSISGQAVGSQHHHHFSANSKPSSRHRTSTTATTGQDEGGYFVVDESAGVPSFRHDQQTNDIVDADANDDDDGATPQAASPESAGGGATAREIERANEVKLSHVVVIVLEPQHAGAYQCFAFNQYESTQSSTYIRVLDDPPKFKDTFRGEVLEPGQDVSLQCSARANPLPEITWSIDEQPIPESTRTRFGDFVTKVSSLSAHT